MEKLVLKELQKEMDAARIKMKEMSEKIKYQEILISQLTKNNSFLRTENEQLKKVLNSLIVGYEEEQNFRVKPCLD